VRVSEQPRFDWQRAWVPRGTSYSLDPNGGYVAEPSHWLHGINQAALLDLSQLRALSVATLLGDPGLGKTYCALAEQAVDDSAVWIDALHYPEDIASAVASAIRTDTDTTVFVDNLDISRLGPEAVVAQILDHVRQRPEQTPAVRLRFVCRSARWPIELEGLLRQTFGLEREHHVAFELLPLTATQVRSAATEQLGTGDSADAFMSAVESRSVTPLAARPITLPFLLDEYREHGELPASRVELYRNACARMCRDAATARLRSSTTTRTTDAGMRLEIAGALAALSVTCGAPRLTLAHAEQQGVLSTHALAESEYFRSKGWTAAFIEEAIDTGLFTLGVNDEFQWSHPTFAEFLCSEWVTDTMSPRQVDEVFLHAGEGPARVVPQLVDAATWLAGAFPAMFRVLLDQHPLPLLRADTQILEDDTKLQIATAMFAWADGPSLGRMESPDRALLKNLSCPPLVEFLRGKLQPGVPQPQIELALDFVRTCELDELGDDVARVLLNPAYPLHARVVAGYVFLRHPSLSPPDVRPVLDGDLTEDTDDELRGICLSLAAPTLAFTDFVSYLTRRRNESLLGSYQSLLYRFEEHLRPGDALTALRWVRWNQRTDLHESLEEAEEQVIQWAFATIQTPEETDELCALIKERVLKHYHLIRSHRIDREQYADPEFLRTATTAAWEALCQLVETIPEQNAYYYVSANPPLMPASAYEQMVARAQQSSNANWRSFLQHFYRPDDAQHRALLESAGGDIAAIVTEVDAAIERQHAYNAQRAEQDAERLAEQVHNVEQAVASANAINAWVFVSRLATDRHDEYHLSETEVWAAASAELRSDLLDLADQFLREHRPPARTWIGQRSFPGDIMIGYCAFLTLEVQRPEALDALPTEVYDHWAAEVAFAARFNSEQGRKRSQSLLRRFEHVPGIPALFIDAPCSTDPNNSCSLVLTLLGLERVWPTQTREVLATRLAALELCPRCQYDGTQWLASSDAEDSAVAQIVEAAVQHDELAAPTVAGALWSADERTWPLIQEYIDEDADRQREMTVRAADTVERELDDFITRRTLDQLFDVWCWFGVLAAEHEQQPGANFVAPPEDADRTRIAIARFLSGSGDPTSSELLRRMAERSPREAAHLLFLEAAAQVAADRQSWQPTTIEHMLVLALSGANRLVATARQLRDVMADEIEEVAHELVCDRAMLEPLWEVSNGARKPVDENTWCQHLVVAMRDRLTSRRIVANREPELRQGEELDILTETFSLGHPPVPLQCITEAKGCWHREIETAHTTQLAARYMRDLVTHGIYLIFWTYCDQWDTTDGRYTRTRALRNRMRRELSALDTEDDIVVAQRYFSGLIQTQAPVGVDVICIVVDGRLSLP
jgi:hypothetical protein